MTPYPKIKTIYLAGPMQGIPEFNFPRFNAVTWCLRQDGHTVFNPAERDIERAGGVDISKGNAGGVLDAETKKHFSLRQALADDTDFICMKANCIALLPGWEKSNGAMAEHRLAVALASEGIEVAYLDGDLVALMERAYEVAHAQAA